MKHPKHLHPANGEELATIAQETGAEVLHGALSYPSESGGWQLGELDLSDYIEKYRDQELVVIIGSLGKTRAKRVICGICGFVLNEVGECSRCRLAAREGAKRLKERGEALEALDTALKMDPEAFPEERAYNRYAQRKARDAWKKWTDKDYPHR